MKSVVELEARREGRVVKRGKLKVWTGAVPSTSIEEAVESLRQAEFRKVCEADGRALDER